MNERLARKTIADHLGVPEPLVLDSVAFRDLGADSLDLVELTLALEQAFDVGIPDDEAYSCLTVGDALAVLSAAETRRAARIAGADRAHV
jgi:acyl carrier protein